MLGSKFPRGEARVGDPAQGEEQDGETAFVCEPEPKALAHAMDRLWSDRACAAHG